MLSLSRTAVVLLSCVWLPLAGLAQDLEGQTEAMGAHYQLTYVWQSKPGFNAPYTGPNSLVPEREYSNTVTASGYFGFRPWVGGEIYFNPEVTQGQAFSNLNGLGGFTNGELTRASSSFPQLYRQRLFLRQTWNRGGGEDVQPSDLNQLAGLVEKNRRVLTIGNFSTLDIFDNNAFAKDPRRQFMNWGMMSYAAYDYAADARGFGWGAALEWYEGDWALRVARMTGPVTPNDLPVDFNILNHYGDQIELEHAHELRGQPGKMRVLAWRDRAVLARYRDAMDYGAANNQVPDIFKVRYGEQFKYGAGLNLEQAVSSNLGVFFRAMLADGATETYAFTEVDQSIAAGVSLKGGGWARPRDTVGLGWMQNGLSTERRDYLRAGGISFFIGDGQLRYQPETIVELYYSVHMAGRAFVTLDVQHIGNPAYNADRGPVIFAGVRLHAEY